GKFREAGIAIPLSLFIVLLAALTFTTSLLRLAGRWAFWPYLPRPGGADERAEGVPQGFWRRLAGSDGLQARWRKLAWVLEQRPGTVWLASVAIMAPFALAAMLLYQHLSYDLIGDLPTDAPSVAGTRALEEHFPSGLLGPLTVLVVNPQV